MTNNAQFIPVILPDEPIGQGVSGVNGAPFLGHGAFIFVDSSGNATYYEYGHYAPGATGVLTNNTSGDNSNIRSQPITSGTIQFGSNGNITESSLQNALDQVFGSGGLYAGQDPGMLLATPFALNAAQYSNITAGLSNFESGVNAGQKNYNLTADPNCINFVYDMATAAGTGANTLTISATQNWPLTTSTPSIAGDAILVQANSLGIPTYQYFSSSSWNATNGDESNIQQVSNLDNLSAIEDFEIQFGKALVSVGLFAGSFLLGVPADWTTEQTQTTSGGLFQWILGSNNGDQITATFGGSSTPENVAFSNSSGTPITGLAYNSNGSDTLTGYSSTGTTLYTQVNSVGSNGQLDAAISGQGDSFDLNNAAVNLAAGATATVAGSADAIAAAAGSSVTIDAGSDTVNTTAAGSTVGNNTVTFVASTENVALPLTIGIDVATGQQVSVTGTDGTMTINNNSTGNGAVSNTIDFNGGSSEIQQFSGLPSGEKELDTGYTGTNGGGTQTYQQTDTLSGSQLNVTITGTGDTCDLSNVTITLANGASCTVTGTNDTIALGANDTVTITGSSDSASITGNSSSVTESGTSDSATASASSDSINLTGTSDTGTLTGSGTGDGILESGSNDTGNLQGSSENASLTGSGDTCTSTGSTNGINLQGASETGTLEGSGGAVTAYSSGSSDTANLEGTGETGALQTSGTLNVSGNSDAAYLQSGSESGSLTGNSDSLYDTGSGSNAIASGSSDSLYIQGTGETGIFSGTGTSNGIQVSGASDAAVLQGTHESATLSGTSDSSTVTGASDGITLSGTSETGTLQAMSDTISVTGASDGAYLQGYQETASLQGSSDSATVTGNNDVAYLQANLDTASLSGSADTADLYSTYGTVTSATTGETVNIMAEPYEDADTLDVSHDAVNSVIQTHFSVDGTYNTIVGSYDLMNFSGGYNAVDASYSVINDLDATGDWLDGSNDMYDGANESGLYNGPDPIVLNLTGQQVQSVGLTDSNTYFDVQNDGQRILTGWVTPGEGLLVYDPNNTNNVTDEANLVSSFSQLQSLDSNHDGVLNAQDTAWSQLKVWVDQAGNGNFSSSSLDTLAQLGITSINVNDVASSTTAVSANSNNNTILGTSTFTFANGSTGDMAALIFADAPNIGTGSNSASGQLTASQFNQIVSATAAYNPTALSGASPSLVANDNSAQNLQLAASH